MKSLLVVILLSLFAFTGCGGGGGGSAPTDTGGGTTPTDTTSTLSGTAIDGLIKSATVCIDTNENNLCDNGEPTTTTDDNGNYSFDVNNSLGTKPLLVLGGIDTATNKPFDGILKETVIIGSSDITAINITPLTTIATELFQNEQVTNTSYTPQNAKETIASNLGLSTVDITKNPLTDVTIFEKTQKIVQATKLLQSELQKDNTNQTLNQKAFGHIMKQVAITLKNDTTTEDIDTDTLIEKLETTTYNDEVIVIPANLKTFTKSYVDEIDTKLSALTTTTELANIQSGIEVYTNEAKSIIKNNQTTTLSSTLLSFVAQSTVTIAENGRKANTTTPTISNSALATPPQIPTI